LRGSRSADAAGMTLSVVEQPREDAPASARKRTRFSVLWRRPSFGLAVVYLVVLVLVALFAPLLAPYDPIKQDLANPLADISPEHLLGTDDLGRDVLSRLLWGARPTLVGTAITILTACLIGIPWGLVAGYAGGVVDLVLMRIADSVLVFPGVVLAL